MKSEGENQENADDTTEAPLPSTPLNHTVYEQDTPRSTPTDGSWSGGRDAQGRPRSFHEMREQTTMPYVTTTASDPGPSQSGSSSDPLPDREVREEGPAAGRLSPIEELSEPTTEADE